MWCRIVAFKGNESFNENIVRWFRFNRTSFEFVYCTTQCAIFLTIKLW